MLLGYNTNGFQSHALDDALQIIADLGYRSVAITLDHGALDPFAVFAAKEAAHVAQALRDLDLSPVIETGARYLLDPWRKHRPTLLEDDPADRARRADFLASAIETAALIGAGVVSLWSGKRPDVSAAALPELDERLVEELLPLCARARACDVVLAFEPEPGMHIETMADFERIAAMVNHDAFSLTLDVGHAHLTEPSAAGTVREYGGRIANVHLEGMRRPHHDHLVPWEGDLDMAEIFVALNEIGYQGPASFELSRHSHDAVAVARRAFEFASSLLPS